MPEPDLQLSRRSCGEADADDAVAGVLEGLAHGVERERLAGAGAADDDVEWLAGPRHSRSTIRSLLAR